METLLYRCDEGVATITLNRPEARNAIGATMTGELDALLQQIARDESVRALILTGAGGAFCAGGDVRSMNNAPVRNAQTVRTGMRRALSSRMTCSAFSKRGRCSRAMCSVRSPSSSA